MPSFLDLSPELRQMTLEYAFDAAVDDDIRFNHMLHNKYLHFYSRHADGLPIYSYSMLGYLGLFYDESFFSKIFAVDLQKLNIVLDAVDPGLKDDILYTCGKALNSLEKRLERIEPVSHWVTFCGWIAVRGDKKLAGATLDPMGQ